MCPVACLSLANSQLSKLFSQPSQRKFPISFKATVAIAKFIWKMQKKVWYYEKWVGRHASFLLDDLLILYIYEYKLPLRDPVSDMIPQVLNRTKSIKLYFHFYSVETERSLIFCAMSDFRPIFVRNVFAFVCAQFLGSTKLLSALLQVF